MPKPTEICIVETSGGKYDFWETVEVSHSVAEPIDHAMLTVSEPSSKVATFSALKMKPGDPAKVYLAGVLVLDGTVYLRQAAYDKQQHQVQIGIVAGAQDVIPATTLNAPGQYLNSTLQQIVSAAFGTAGVSFLNANGLGAKSIVKGAATALQGKEWEAGQIILLEYDGTDFQVLSQTPAVTALPKARISTAALSSIPFETFVAQTMALVSNAGLTPTFAGGGASFTVPLAGTYLVVFNGQGRVVVNTATNAGTAAAILVNGTQVGNGGVSSYYPGAADQSLLNNFTAVLALQTTDVVSFASSAGCTSSSQFTLGQAFAGYFDLVRLGP